ncbi:MAG: aminotransferase class I/II-fold pyridoxal phosphate-dependent enzyme [Clostridia bacterium]|nr:aminotransferase class I/II-fold pyridoxal phosphate-dependent enzyme [Clostridia bacterium]
MNYYGMTKDDLNNQFNNVKKKYAQLAKEKLSLDMSRGKPCAEQLDIALPLLDILNSSFKSPKGADYRNYGLMDGIPEMKAIFAELLEIEKEKVFVGGGSSLNLMYDMITRAYCFGILGNTAWCKLPKIKFLCPVPGYDRHFAVCELFGIDMISIPMNEQGPNMDLVEEYVKDPAVKGIWCVPRFSNPDGVVYSDEVVDRLVSMKTAAPDFRIFWDNAYCIHELYPDAQKLKNIFKAAELAGNADRVYMFASTSKITFGGAGISMVALSEKNLAATIKLAGIQTINYDKLNQFAHAIFLKSAENVRHIMQQHANIIRPKFELVDRILSEAFADCANISWSKPKGGYFITLKVPEGMAKKIIELCKKVGLVLTPAGSTHPLKQDDSDSIIRIAPTFPNITELEEASNVLVCCMSYAILEKLTA